MDSTVQVQKHTSSHVYVSSTLSTLDNWQFSSRQACSCHKQTQQQPTQPNMNSRDPPPSCNIPTCQNFPGLSISGTLSQCLTYSVNQPGLSSKLLHQHVLSQVFHLLHCSCQHQQPSIQVHQAWHPNALIGCQALLIDPSPLVQSQHPQYHSCCQPCPPTLTCQLLPQQYFFVSNFMTQQDSLP